ncbi:hypothetical protein [Winogradskyella forsetii]|jgi:hypothetical protein|uniref:hypothetical protein n=1 Tax=Winogradskyella forsetii TaxID=2686077 RepID=UPI0015BE192E|nr:hypothetical protein [Winogradskyella forsetii]
MRIIKTLIGLLAGVFILFLAFIYISNAYVLPWEKEEAIQATLEMGGLNELPSGIKNLQIDKRGTIFTRQFIIELEFEDSKEIDNWIKQSKRLKNNVPKIKDNIKTYEIFPGENDAYGGKVEIQDKKVRIDMSWS